VYLFHLSIAQRKLRLPIVRQSPPNAQSWRSSGRSITVSISRFDTRTLRVPYPIFDDSRLENQGKYSMYGSPNLGYQPQNGQDQPEEFIASTRDAMAAAGGLCLGRESDRSHFTLLTNRVF